MPSEMATVTQPSDADSATGWAYFTCANHDTLIASLLKRCAITLLLGCARTSKAGGCLLNHPPRAGRAAPSCPTPGGYPAPGGGNIEPGGSLAPAPDEA